MARHFQALALPLFVLSITLAIAPGQAFAHPGHATPLPVHLHAAPPDLLATLPADPSHAGTLLLALLLSFPLAVVLGPTLARLNAPDGTTGRSNRIGGAL